MPRRKDFSGSDTVARIQGRDAVLIESLVHAYTRHLYNACLGMGFDPHAAGELAQDVWITFYEKAPGFEGRSHVRTWLFGILHNKALERRRQRSHLDLDEITERQVDERFDGAGSWRSPPVSPEQFVLALETEKLLERCLDNLSENQRMAFVLKEVEEFTSKDICNVLGVTLTNLGALLFRARNRLRECIESAHGEKSGPRKK